MVLSRSGTWWRGTEGSDIDEYLHAYADGGYAVGRVVHVACGQCGGEIFGLEMDDEEGCARRTCRACSATTFMLDSEELAEDAELGDAACPCGNESFEIAVGFALLEDGEVRWVYIGMRCIEDGVLGVYTDWKIDYSPSAELFGKV